MRLAIDAGTLVAVGPRARGRRLIADARLDLVVAADAWSETKYELQKRIALLAERRNLRAESSAQLLDDIQSATADNVTAVPHDVYADALPTARLRIPRDPRDAPTVALALTLECGVWTADHDFFGCGVPVWITETLSAHLDGRELPWSYDCVRT
jgi:predicted nucleic acid-binding protein